MTTYSYENMRDKSPKGIFHETMTGLAKMAVYYYETFGLPVNIAKEFFKTKSSIENLHAYMSFRNDHPEVFKEKTTKE